MLSALNPGKPDTSKRYPDEVKELAYQLWAFVTGRDVTKTHQLLLKGEYGDPVEVSYQSVAYWAREHNWAARATKEIQAIAPDLRHQAFSELLFAGLDGAKYIRRVNAGEEEPNKVRAMLAVAAVDRIGFSPVGKGSPSIDAPKEHEEITVMDLASLSPEELSRIEQQIRQRKR